MTMDYGTSSYTQETPRWLWQHFTNGPGDRHERYSDRITALIALDVLRDPDTALPDPQRREAEQLVEQLDGAYQGVLMDV